MKYSKQIARMQELNCLAPAGEVVVPGCDHGPLQGLTFAVKDLFDVAGQITGGGNPDWRKQAQPASVHAPVVAELLDAGASLVGKTMTDDLACGMLGENRHYGTPRNPRYPEFVPGGSSSGSVSAVAAGTVDFALGTDTGGSIRVPASFCGIYGMRPTHGALSTHGVLPQTPLFDTVGWFARDRLTLERIGMTLLPSDSHACARKIVGAASLLEISDAAVQMHFCKRLAALEVPTAADLAPLTLEEVRRVYWRTMGRQLWQLYGNWFRQTQPTLAWGLAERFEEASKVTANDFQEASEERQSLASRLHQLLADGSIWVFPTTPSPPLKLKQPLEIQAAYRAFTLRSTGLAAIAGLPQVSIPAGEVNGAPVGLSLLGARGSDRALLRLACEFEQRWQALQLNL